MYYFLMGGKLWFYDSVNSFSFTGAYYVKDSLWDKKKLCFIPIQDMFLLYSLVYSIFLKIIYMVIHELTFNVIFFSSLIRQ